MAICVATRWEFNALGRAFPLGHKQVVRGFPCLVCQEGNLKTLVLQTGMGEGNVTKAFLGVLGEQSWDLIVSSGFAGALVPTRVGTFVISSQVFDLDHQLMLDFSGRGGKEGTYYYQLATNIASEIDEAPLLGSIVMVRRIVWEASEKSRIADQTHGLALDMESGTIGRLTQAGGGAFLVVRTISDLLDESLPVNFNLFSRKSTWIKGVLQLTLQPERLGQMNRLRKQTLMAGAQLTRFFQSFSAHLRENP